MTRAKTFRLIQGLSDHQLGHEERAHADDHVDLKIWLRLLACSTQIEQQIRQRLRVRFKTTLPRFDYMAQLNRHPSGLRMNQLSSYLMVTGGNVTGLTDQLAEEGLVKRIDDPEDRRSYLVALTSKGQKVFAEMAIEHEAWIAELFSGLDLNQKHELYEQLARLRLHLTQQKAKGEDAASAWRSSRKSHP